MFFAVAMATAKGRIPKLCMLVELERLYILCPLTEALSLTASELWSKV